jgi:hypothetical protein
MLPTLLRPSLPLESFEGEETDHDGQELVVSLGYCACSHRCHGDQLDGGQEVSDHRAFALFAGFGACRLFPVSQCEEGAGQENPHPGDPQEGVGGAVRTLSAVDFATVFRQRYDCYMLTPLVNMLRKAKNTKCHNYNHFLFTEVVRV